MTVQESSKPAALHQAGSGVGCTRTTSDHLVLGESYQQCARTGLQNTVKFGSDGRGLGRKEEERIVVGQKLSARALYEVMDNFFKNQNEATCFLTIYLRLQVCIWWSGMELCRT